jgi:hypothetical protein
MPLISVVAACRLLWSPRQAGPDRVMAVVSVAALGTLVQFPYSRQIYFFYCAPLVVLAALALASIGRTWPRRPGFLLSAGFLLTFMLVVPMRNGERWDRAPIAQVGGARSGLYTTAADAEGSNRALELVRAHARGGWVWAGPDAPEIPFLVNRRNPTRTIYDFFDADFDADPRVRAEKLMRTLEDHGVTAVALNLYPQFSGPYPPAINDALRSRYPESERAGKYEIRWKR